MTDIGWISAQAQQIHGTFLGLFYVIVTLLLTLGVFLEYFKWPLGGVPSFGTLVGRAVVASIILQGYSEIANTIAEVTDALSSKLGDLNQFNLVLSSVGDHLKTLSFSWTSVRDLSTTIVCFFSFFLLYVSVHIVEAFLLYAWVLLYVFSPVMIALFVLPATSSATKALFRTLFEMGCWKIVWTVLAALLWSTALSDINKPEYNINFLTSSFYNLILAGSILLTPIMVHSLINSGLAGMAGTVGAITVGAATLSPGKVAGAVKSGMSKARSGLGTLSERFKKQDGSNPFKRPFVAKKGKPIQPKTEKSKQANGESQKKTATPTVSRAPKKKRPTAPNPDPSTKTSK